WRAPVGRDLVRRRRPSSGWEGAMRGPRFVGWAVLVAALAGPPTARGQTYNFTQVAITGTGSPFAGVFAPSLNAAGTVAFGATLTAGGQGIFTGNGGAV